MTHEHELPPDPDLDDLPDEIARGRGASDTDRDRREREALAGAMGADS